MNLAEQFDRFVIEHEFSTLTIHKTEQGFQANLQMAERGSFRIRIEPTPSAALCAVLSVDEKTAAAAGVFD
jgi:hypothetical protein